MVLLIAAHIHANCSRRPSSVQLPFTFTPAGLEEPPRSAGLFRVSQTCRRTAHVPAQVRVSVSRRGAVRYQRTACQPREGTSCARTQNRIVAVAGRPVWRRVRPMDSAGCQPPNAEDEQCAEQRGNHRSPRSPAAAVAPTPRRTPPLRPSPCLPDAAAGKASKAHRSTAHTCRRMHLAQQREQSIELEPWPARRPGRQARSDHHTTGRPAGAHRK